MRIISINVHYQDGLGYQDYYMGLELKKLGHEVHFISSDWHFRFPDYKNTVQKIIGPRYVGTGIFENEYGCKVHRLKGKLIGSWYWLIGFKEKIKELQPDLIVSHGVFTFQSIRLGFWGKKLGCPIIFDDHTTETFYRTDPFAKFIFWNFRTFFAPSIYKVAKKIVGISDTCITVLDKIFGLSGSKVVMIPLGADTDVYKQSKEWREEYRSYLGVQEDELLVLYTGKILEKKRLHHIFEALNTISTDARITFHIIGNVADDYKARFEDCINKSKHKVIFRTAVNQSTLAKAYNAADVGIWLDFSNSTCDASACGLPVIVTDLMPERVTHQSGILVERDNIDQIKNAIESIILNPSLRQKMSENAIAFVKNELSWQKHTIEFIK